MDPAVADISARLDRVMHADRARFLRRLHGIREAMRHGRPFDRGLAALQGDIERSEQRFARRAALAPKPTFDADLPVIARRADIARAIAENQVIVLCGETGSGKTTQLPKICLDLGRGVGGTIGHTQPRRIAARAVAQRVAAELGVTAGHAVGYKVRFTDQTSPDSLIKVMTDGILLAESQHDPLLEAYDTLIIDEAHERSLNIDFLLGFLRQLLPRRPDLRLIITSATIDPGRFSRHFAGPRGDAPIIEVSGRTYPVEVRHRPPAIDGVAPDADELEGAAPEPTARDMLEAILAAVDELVAESRSRAIDGDILIFLSGEREIRDTADALRKRESLGKETEVLPLYARLSADAQQRVFAPLPPGIRRRIVLATNVAETSLTVPGIRYVIDPGEARISRYSSRTKVQRLPIEPISQASANQRKGRCGRLSEGVCIRLYTQADFDARPAFTDPEILRTNLASVILQMKALNLGEPELFPFIDPPDGRMIRDGYQTLFELGAIDYNDPQRRLTNVGRALARLPIDPRIGRMILAARHEKCLEQALVIAAALSVQDPRERPLDAQAKADEAHASFRDPASDFLTLLRLWHTYHDAARRLSRNQLKKWCRTNFLSVVRMREWLDIHSQLFRITNESLESASGSPPNRPRPPQPAPTRPARADATATTAEPAPEPLADNIHRSLLTGLLSNIGVRGETAEYTGPRTLKFHLHPSSTLFREKPRWVMASELVQTSRLFARTIGPTRPEWIETAAAHLIDRSYSEPFWDRNSAHVRAYEKVSLYGVVLVPKRRVDYGRINPQEARDIFIRAALVDGEFQSNAPFLMHNLSLVDSVRTLEDKARRRDLLAEAGVRIAFYDHLVPDDVCNGPAFDRWRKHAEKRDEKVLFMRAEHVMSPAAASIRAEDYPDEISASGATFELAYRFDPGGPTDGVTIEVPLAALNQLDTARFDWLVPGHLREKVTELIRGLPKAIRVNFVGAAKFAEAACERLRFGEGSLTARLSTLLGAMVGVEIPPGAWQLNALPDHLRMNFRVLDDKGKLVAQGRDLAAIRAQFQRSAAEVFERMTDSPWRRDGVTRWDFGDVPVNGVEVRHQGMTLRGYPAVIDQGDSVSLRLLDTRDAAEPATTRGVRRLFMLHLKAELRGTAMLLPKETLARLGAWYATIGPAEELQRSLLEAVTQRVFLDQPANLPPVRTAMEFELRLRGHWHRLGPVSAEIVDLASRVLESHHKVALRLADRIPTLWEPAIEDIREQLALLLPRGFLASTPHDWLTQTPRYLAAVEMRLRKLSHGGLERDSRAMSQVHPWVLAYLQRRQAHHDARIADPQLELFRWMLEELRVSMFAQELGVAFPISLKRIEQQWALTRRA